MVTTFTACRAQVRDAGFLACLVLSYVLTFCVGWFVLDIEMPMMLVGTLLFGDIPGIFAYGAGAGLVTAFSRKKHEGSGRRPE